MGSKSDIEWTDASWSPIRARCWEIQSDGSGKERLGWHCEHVSEGCRNCYAEKINLRLGTGYDFKPGNLRGKPGYDGSGTDRPELFLDEKMLLAPLKWKKPRMIFVCSMTDLFADFVPDEWIDQIFAVMALCPQHTFQVLTKRAERMREYFARPTTIEAFASSRHYAVACKAALIARETGAAYLSDGGAGAWPLDNVWLGVSTERQKEADERIPLLLQTPAAVRFISAEPLLGPIDLHALNLATERPSDALRGVQCVPDDSADGYHNEPMNKLDWVIVGGESGSGARPFHVEWADSIVSKCKEAGVPCFVKQFGSNPFSDGYPLELKSRKGGDQTEWPDRLQTREMPHAL